MWLCPNILVLTRSACPPGASAQIWAQFTPQLAPDSAHGSAFSLLLALMPMPRPAEAALAAAEPDALAWLAHVPRLWGRLAGHRAWDDGWMELLARASKARHWAPPGLTEAPELEGLIGTVVSHALWPVQPHNPAYLCGSCTLNATGQSRVTQSRR